MSNMLNSIYRFLPVQLLLLHFRKYQLLIVFWVIVFATVSGHFATSFGASSLFLAPEYLGQISFVSMLLLGAAMAVFVMAWNITTFIIHSHRVPFMGATRQAFLKYCINNSLLPAIFLVFYSVVTIRFQLQNEHAQAGQILKFQLGFYIGFFTLTAISFLYFFRVDKDLLKTVLSRITNPSLIREIIPYDSLDYEIDIIRADSYLTETFRVERCCDLQPYHPRLLNTVLRRHHRNAITLTIFSFVLLIVLGIFMEDPRLRIPAGAGFLILFSIMMGIVGAAKYFLRSWEILGWAIFIFFISFLVKQRVFDLRSIAYGVDYQEREKRPVYNYQHLQYLFTPALYNRDKATEEQRLTAWKTRKSDTTKKQPLIIITASGGGSRAAYWTFHTLQYIDSITNGGLYNNTVFMTGASGGMMGAAYWRELHHAHKEGKIKNPYLPQYQENIGKDLLNAIIFSFASVDLISPFNKISIAGYSYTKDRGYAMEQELIRNTEGLLDKKIGDNKEPEKKGEMPQMVVNGTIINDGRKLLISAQPVAYLTQPHYSLTDSINPPIDAVDFAEFFSGQNPYNMRLTTALRMTATFPFVLPVVKLPSQPYMNVMDAGMRDNFGTEVASRYLYVMKDWIEQNVDDVIFLEIRDTREHEVFTPTEQSSLSNMIYDPFFVIHMKWEPFQSYTHGYIKDYLSTAMKDKVHFVTLQYIPQEDNKSAALNFHLTQKEKLDLYQSIYNPQNQQAIGSMLKIIE